MLCKVIALHEIHGARCVFTGVWVACRAWINAQAPAPYVHYRIVAA